MTDADLAKQLGKQVYRIKQDCDALLGPQVDPLLIMRNMRADAQKMVTNTPDNSAIAAINDKVIAVFEDFKAEDYRLTGDIRQELTEIAADALAEASRLYPGVNAQ